MEFCSYSLVVHLQIYSNRIDSDRPSHIKKRKSTHKQAKYRHTNQGERERERERNVKNHVRKQFRGRKVGVTHEKMGI